MRAAVRMLCLTMLAVAMPLIAVAEDDLARPADVVAREKLGTGTRLYRVREFEKAIEEYKAGALREDAAIFHYNLGQCYRQLGKYEDAQWHYQRFLDRASPLPAKYKAAVETFMREMKAELEKQAAKREPIEPAQGKPIEPVMAKPATPEARVVTVIEPGEPWYADGLGWGLTATGVVACTVSLYLLFDARSLEDYANDEPSMDKQDDLRDRAGERRLAGVIVGVAGIGALATGIIKLAIAPERRERAITAGLDVGITGNGFVVMGRF
jgi:tetratricopeptide (TPR) repeat protein